ncbi:sulfurtransferase TusA family protein [Streptomyces coeruleorubidus]|uniref:sulfurtransferase TusA family protein n=1 Tax=Streptomyces coeruleorubidus TaxID=116188 RepID=UPI003137FF5E
MLCVTLLLRLRNEIADAQPGTVVHVIATDPAAPLDLPAWCRPVYGLRFAADGRIGRHGRSSALTDQNRWTTRAR